jgi:NADPH2:quinone reductase
VVDRLGERVSGIEPGRVVAVLPITGAYAEFVCLPPGELVPVPSGLDAAEARRAHELLGTGGVTGKIVLVRTGSVLASRAV